MQSRLLWTTTLVICIVLRATVLFLSSDTCAFTATFAAKNAVGLLVLVIFLVQALTGQCLRDLTSNIVFTVFLNLLLETLQSSFCDFILCKLVALYSRDTVSFRFSDFVATVLILEC